MQLSIYHAVKGIRVQYSTETREVSQNQGIHFIVGLGHMTILYSVSMEGVLFNSRKKRSALRYLLCYQQTLNPRLS